MGLEVDEVLEDLQADGVAFFGVELEAEDVLIADDGAEITAVVGGGYDIGGAGGGAVVGVDKIAVGAIGYASQQRVGAIMVELVPAHVGDFVGGGGGEAGDVAGNEGEARVVAHFVAGLEEVLHPDADAEEGDALLHGR